MKIRVGQWLGSSGTYFKDNSLKKENKKSFIAFMPKKGRIQRRSDIIAWLLYHPSKIYPVVGTTSLKD